MKICLKNLLKDLMEEFLHLYYKIIKRTVSLLKDNSTACFVVGDIRSREDHCYRNFPGHTIEAFQEAGAKLYNDAILLTAVGSTPIRAKFQFPISRKMGKLHQNVLIFLKGEWRAFMEDYYKAAGEEKPPVSEVSPEEFPEDLVREIVEGADYPD